MGGFQELKLLFIVIYGQIFGIYAKSDAVDSCWCLNIIRGDGQEPLEIREIQDSRALVEFVEGFLKEWNHSNVYTMEFRPSCMITI